MECSIYLLIGYKPYFIYLSVYLEQVGTIFDNRPICCANGHIRFMYLFPNHVLLYCSMDGTTFKVDQVLSCCDDQFCLLKFQLLWSVSSSPWLKNHFLTPTLVAIPSHLKIAPLKMPPDFECVCRVKERPSSCARSDCSSDHYFASCDFFL